MATAKKGPTKKTPKTEKRVTRYSYEDELEPRTPETGHTSLLPPEERVVSLPMDNGWTKAIDIGKMEEYDSPVIVDIDPVLDPVLFWAGKRSHRDVPLLPLQRNEVVSESRIARIIERAREAASRPQPRQGLLFADLEKTFRETDRDRRVEFYTHEEGWKNKLICGDSLQVMESLLHYEDLRGKVQMVYLDPPYGIKYDSNFQQRVDTTKNNEKDRADDVLTIKAYNDSWALGIHSYLSYLTERLYLMRELLKTSGSIFVQISDDHVHRVRAVLDEVFGASNYLAEIILRKRAYQPSQTVKPVNDFLLWYAKDTSQVTTFPLFDKRKYDPENTKFNRIELPDGEIVKSGDYSEAEILALIEEGARLCRVDYPLVSQDEQASLRYPVEIDGKTFIPALGRHWSIREEGMHRLKEVGRVVPGKQALYFKQYFDEFPWVPLSNVWMDVAGERDKVYSVQTSWKAVLRCIHMTTSPGDLVFDPTCGSGTIAYCAERSGRRWVTCDTSRVAINVARQRLLSAVYDHYRTRNGSPSSGLHYETAKRVTPSSIAFDLEPENVELVDRPLLDPAAIRVTGPFESMTMGRYSLEDWKGFVFSEDGDAGRLENYISVIARLYRPEAALSESTGIIHAVVETEKERLAISVGPIAGRVTARQIHDAAQEASAGGIREVHVLGWAFEPNVGEIKDKAEDYYKVQVSLAMIRPDTLSEGLKIAKPDTLFSPLALPDVEIRQNGSEFEIVLSGVAVFDRKDRATKYMKADSGYVSAWYLDEDYDGDCFVDCQMFFDFKKVPAIESALGIKVEDEEWTLRLESDSFKAGKYHRIAARVVDVYGNESTVVKDLST